ARCVLTEGQRPLAYGTREHARAWPDCRYTTRRRNVGRSEVRLYTFTSTGPGAVSRGEERRIYESGAAETAGDGRTGARCPPGPSGGGDPGSRSDGVRSARGAA